MESRRLSSISPCSAKNNKLRFLERSYDPAHIKKGKLIALENMVEFVTTYDFIKNSLYKDVEY